MDKSKTIVWFLIFWLTFTINTLTVFCYSINPTDFQSKSAFQVAPERLILLEKMVNQLQEENIHLIQRLEILEEKFHNNMSNEANPMIRTTNNIPQRPLSEIYAELKNETIRYDCCDLRRKGIISNGIYVIKLEEEIKVECDMATEGGGWTILKRQTSDGGNKRDIFEKGYENIVQLTKNKDQEIRFDTQTNSALNKSFRYEHYHVASVNNGYTVTIGSYSGIQLYSILNEIEQDSPRSIEMKVRNKNPGFCGLEAKEMKPEFKVEGSIVRAYSYDDMPALKQFFDPPPNALNSPDFFTSHRDGVKSNASVKAGLFFEELKLTIILDVGNSSELLAENEIAVDCCELRRNGMTQSGSYKIKILKNEVEVECDMVTEGGGWTVITRGSTDNQANTEKGWKRNFFTINLGRDIVAHLTRNNDQEIIYDLESLDPAIGKSFIKFDHYFQAGPEQSYALTVGNYSIPKDAASFRKDFPLLNWKTLKYMDAKIRNKNLANCGL